MRPHLLQVDESFWNIRGSFKVFGVVEVGTQASLVRRRNGKFVLIDSYSLTGDLEERVRRLTHDGRDIEAVLNVHPFHTLHVRSMQALFPDAKLYGTARHLSRFSDLPWEDMRTEDPELHAAFKDDFAFSVPQGVDFISDDENLHFSSVMVLHKVSRTIHVDDTLMYIRFPKPLGRLGLRDRLSWHPTLSRVLQKRRGAAEEFRTWATELARDWGDAANLCAAHSAALLARSNQGGSIHDRIVAALGKVHRTLASHERRYG